MEVPLVDLKRQYLSIRAEIDTKLREVLESGRFIAGENVRSFEKEFASYCGTKYGVGVGSGTDALTLCLAALKLDTKDEVVTVPNTFIATVDGISRSGATILFVDVERETGNMNIEHVRRRISSRTRVLLPVHLYGNPVDMDRLNELAEANNLLVVEDAAQAHGAVYKGRKAGSLGDVSCFSFYPTKDLGAYGDAGMILTNDAEIVERLRMMRNYGEREKYHHDLIGCNSRLDEIQAAVLRVKLRHLDRWVESRRQVARKYHERLSTMRGIETPAERPDTKCAYYSYVIRTKDRNPLQRWLAKRGITTIIHYPIPIHLQKAYRHLHLPRGSFPIAEALAHEVLSLPMFAELTDEEVQYVCKSIESFQRYRGVS